MNIRFLLFICMISISTYSIPCDKKTEEIEKTSLTLYAFIEHIQQCNASHNRHNKQIAITNVFEEHGKQIIYDKREASQINRVKMAGLGAFLRGCVGYTASALAAPFVPTDYAAHMIAAGAALGGAYGWHLSTYSFLPRKIDLYRSVRLPNITLYPHYKDDNTVIYKPESF